MIKNETVLTKRSFLYAVIGCYKKKEASGIDSDPKETLFATTIRGSSNGKEQDIKKISDGRSKPEIKQEIVAASNQIDVPKSWR